MGLMPLDMATFIHANDLNKASDIGLGDCLTCGACAFVCPSRIPLVQFFAHAKGEIAAMGRDRKRLDTIKQLADAKVERFEREKREKAEQHAKRKAERERAAAAESSKKELI